MIKISSQKVAELRTHYLQGGDTEPETVIAKFEFSGQEELDAHLERLRQKFPDEFPPLEVEEEYTYFLKTNTGLMQELEMLRNKKNVVMFAIKEPKDLVTLTIKGKTITVDLVQLAKFPQDSPHGVPNSRVIELAEIARG